MAIETLNGEPGEFFAGDTVKWRKSFADYPASSWSLTYAFNGPTRFFVRAVADGDDFILTMPAEVTPGVYDYVAYATDGDKQRITVVPRGTIRIKPDLGAQNSEVARLQKTLTALEDAYHDLVQKQNISVSVGGVSYTLRNSSELRQQMILIRADLARARNADKSLLGHGRGNFVQYRFTT